MQIIRVCRDKERSLLFRGWSCLCVHAASGNDAERASPTVAAASKTARGGAMEAEASIATDHADALRRSTPASPKYPAAQVEVAVREQKERRVKMLVRRDARRYLLH